MPINGISAGVSILVIILLLLVYNYQTIDVLKERIHNCEAEINQWKGLYHKEQEKNEKKSKKITEYTEDHGYTRADREKWKTSTILISFGVVVLLSFFSYYCYMNNRPRVMRIEANIAGHKAFAIQQEDD